MNKKLTLAIGGAAALAFVGGAMASDTGTINSSEAYAPGGAGFVPAFIVNDCGGAGNTGNCNGHGAEAVAQASAGNFFDPAGPFMPQANYTSEGGYLIAAQEPGFSGGLVTYSPTNASLNTSIFAGLEGAWSTTEIAAMMSGAPANDFAEKAIGAPWSLASADGTREEWIDQVVVGYVTSNDTAGDNGGMARPELRQNFRSQLSWTGSTAADLAASVVDQRLEQSQRLQAGTAGAPGPNAPAPFEASMQTLMSAFQATGLTGASSNKGTGTIGGTGGNEGSVTVGANGDKLAQLVAQDVEGYLMSCLNCNSTVSGADHTFAPADLSLTFMPYTSDWHQVPSISHMGTGAAVPVLQ